MAELGKPETIVNGTLLLRRSPVYGQTERASVTVALRGEFAGEIREHGDMLRQTEFPVPPAWPIDCALMPTAFVALVWKAVPAPVKLIVRSGLFDPLLPLPP